MLNRVENQMMKTFFWRRFLSHIVKFGIRSWYCGWSNEACRMILPKTRDEILKQEQISVLKPQKTNSAKDQSLDPLKQNIFEVYELLFYVESVDHFVHSTDVNSHDWILAQFDQIDYPCNKNVKHYEKKYECCILWWCFCHHFQFCPPLGEKAWKFRRILLGNLKLV